MSAIAVGVGVSAAAAAASVALAATKKPPKAAEFTPVDLQAEQGNAISGNLGAFKGATELATKTNTFNASEIQRMNELAMPGYKAMQAKGTANILDWMSGKVPTDVSNAIRTSGAARSVGGGFGGTGMGRNLVARDLGLTSLDLMGKGMDSATKWMSMNKTPTFDVSSMFLTPGQTASFATQQRDTQLAYTNQSNLYNYASDPNTEWRNQMAGLAGQVGGAMVNYLGTPTGSRNGITALANSTKDYGNPF
jgi:hypothetical protein